jgi:glycosyltransferase involved in cell wall biosynthesis
MKSSYNRRVMNISNLPSISIVTPSLNQGSFIEATINSVLSQQYPRLEYIIADGGSTDNTLDVLKKYSGRLHWYSKKDKGQTEAINNGMRKSSGELVAYLNADDILLPGTLLIVAEIFAKNAGVQWLTGRCRIIDENGKAIRPLIALYKNLLLYSRSYHGLLVTNYISQPATFWRRNLLETCGLLDEGLHYVMDYEYWLRLWQITPPFVLHKDLAGFRIQSNSKTTSAGHLDRYVEEEKRIVARHGRSRYWSFMHAAHRWLMTRAYAFINR